MQPVNFTQSEANFVLSMLRMAEFRGEESARVVVSVIDKLKTACLPASLAPVPAPPLLVAEKVMLTLPEALSRIDPSARMRPGNAPVTGELVVH